MAYSLNFRKKVLETKREEKLSFTKVAERFRVSRITVFKWSQRIQNERAYNTKWKKLSKEAVIQDVKKYPDGYYYERAERLGVSTSGVQYAFRALGIKCKRNPNASQDYSRKKIYILPENIENS